MILEYKAKPVKFRIRSGNTEHNTLESLRKHFVWEDVLPLFEDGRLIRWLQRLKEGDIAERVNILRTSKYDVLKVYNVLFRNDPEEKELSSIKDVFKEYSKDKDLGCVIKELAKSLTLSDILKYTRKYRTLWPTLSEQAIRIVTLENSLEKETGADIYAVGKLLSDSGLNPDIVKKCMEYASAKEIYEASLFLAPDSCLELSSAEIEKCLNITGVVKNINESWEREKNIDLYGTTGCVKSLYEFSNVCLEAYLLSKTANATSESISKIFSERFLNVEDSDILYFEKIFMLALFAENKSNAIVQLKRISGYPPAQAILRNVSDYVKIEGKVYHIYKSKDNAGNLKHYIDNLLKFRTSLTEVTPVSPWLSSIKMKEFNDLLGKSGIKSQIDKSWSDYTKIDCDGMSGPAKSLFDFSNICLGIYIKIMKNGQRANVNELNAMASKLDRIDNIDFLYPERMFVRALYEDFKNDPMVRLRKIQEYPPAADILNSEDHSFTKRGHCLRLHNRIPNGKELKYFVTNMVKFRHNG